MIQDEVDIGNPTTTVVDHENMKEIKKDLKIQAVEENFTGNETGKEKRSGNQLRKEGDESVLVVYL